jgi:hypothetical protein
MNTPLTIECEVHFHQRAKGRKEIRNGQEPARLTTAGRVPRVSRLMALAVHFDKLIRAGQIDSYSEVARLGHVTRSRVCQIMNLIQLAPDIQEAVLFLPRTVRGRDRIQLWHLQPIAAVLDWRKQRRLWRRLTGTESDKGL